MQQHQDHDWGLSQKTKQAYGIGFVASLILTLLAFLLVGTHFIPSPSIYAVLTLLAVTQLVVQTVYFLGLNQSESGRWNLLPYLFTILIIAILVTGSLWIMYNLSYNMSH